MENVLVAGVNTRAVACSLKKLGYDVYSSDYFGTIDLQKCTDHYRSILNQKPYSSCGYFTGKFKSSDIEDLAADFTQRCDSIICLAGVSSDNFPKNKIIGNKSVKDVDDKYHLYNMLRNEFNFPKTYRVPDFHEAKEIASNHPEKNFILKPITGSGGYGIRKLDEFNHDVDFSDDEYIDFSNLILQERMDGVNISASVLSTGHESKTILTSQQIIGDTWLGQKEPYGYCGNISPLLDHEATAEIAGVSNVAEEIINQLGLVGSNGVDLVIKDNELFIIEVNPRIQGTMECAELVLNINMAEAHIEACQGTLIDIHPPEGYAVKMIVHAKERSRVGKIDFKDVYDLPAKNVVIEGGEPVATVIKSERVLNDTIYSAGEIVKKVYNNLTTV